LERAAVGETGGQPGAVIEALDVLKDGRARFSPGGKTVVIDKFVFERAGEGFDEGIIVAVGGTTHGSDQIMLGQDLAVGGAGELTAPIGVDDESPSRLTLAQGHAHRGDREWSIEDRAHGPAEHLPAAQIEDCDQIQPALAGEDSGSIGDPDLVGTTDSEALETVRRDRSSMTAVGGGVTILGALPSKEGFGTHEPGDAIAPSGTTEHTGQVRTAIGLTTARKLLPNPSTKQAALELTRAGLFAPLLPVVIAATRDEQGLA